MPDTTAKVSIRDTAKAVIRAIDDAGENPTKLRQGILEATDPLRRRADLLDLGTKRLANHIEANSKHLYYDGELSITLDRVPTGRVIPPHDHGLWEAVLVCTGSLQHAIYQRADDGSVEGYAELELVEDRVIQPGDLALVIPPAEIHSFEALEEDTWLINVVGGNYRAHRNYFNIEAQTVVYAKAGTYRASPPPAPVGATA
ncbi:hypothetical protein MAA5396_03973 [Marinovum algicola]|uniref:Cupin domain-containing protein n=1 Tax=Marinovum algicola TaxID=42444 RepID=A0A975WEV2_9RHOB|nr:hypothetical protein [Marinovum algicola]SEK09088.1 hypothetical protein SAMN04487940_12835 [Marinovum algicola]SLN71671.1 hypothetical protein MAA5396_03973 [Marinovum algicola]